MKRCEYLGGENHELIIIVGISVFSRINRCGSIIISINEETLLETYLSSFPDIRTFYIGLCAGVSDC
jgi:hypothetical protein